MRKNKGFTLIELMIVVAIIAIIAAIAIPGILRARIASNESAAIGSLRSLASSQAEFKQGANVDQDGDGTGEYGLFNELTGTTNLRTDNGSAKAPLSPASITKSLAPSTGASYATKSGYFFQLFLPGGSATGTTDTNTGAAATGLDSTAAADDINAQENAWIAYAWPASFRNSGIRAFVVDRQGEVFATANMNASGDAYYAAATNAPAFNAALISADATNLDFGVLCIKDTANSSGNVLWVASQ